MLKNTLFMNKNIIVFIFSNDKYIYILDKEQIIKKKSNCYYINDIYILNSNNIIISDENNHLKILNIFENENKQLNISTKYKDNVFNYIIPNLIK